jgi:hypothetical protein
VSRLAQRDRAALSLAWGGSVEIPPYVGPLIGRDIEVHAAVSMLEVGTSSPVTITGVEGVRKTRVTAAVARKLAEDPPGGVICIDAASAESSHEELERIGDRIRVQGTLSDRRKRQQPGRSSCTYLPGPEARLTSSATCMSTSTSDMVVRTLVKHGRSQVSPSTTAWEM